MIGYKGLNKDLIGINMQYEVGKTYKMDVEPIPVKQGMHYSKHPLGAIKYRGLYDSEGNRNRFCIVEALGEIAYHDGIFVTNKMKIKAEIGVIGLILAGIKLFFKTNQGGDLMYYKRCAECGANLDPGERCDCEDYVKNDNMKGELNARSKSNNNISTGSISHTPGTCKSSRSAS